MDCRVNSLRPLLSALFWNVIQASLFNWLLDQLKTGLAHSRFGIKAEQNDLSTWLFLFLMLWLSDYLVTLVHEGGHFLMDCLLRFEVHSFQAGPLKFVRARDGFRLRLDWRRGPFGGAVAAYPYDDHSLRLRFMLVVAAGPLASVLLGVVAWRLLVAYLAPCQTLALPSGDFLLALIGNPDPLCLAVAVTGGSTLNPFVLGLLFLLMWGAVISGLTNLLLPYSGKHGVGDGLRLLRLGIGGTSARRELVALQLSGYSVFGVRPRDWPVDLVRGRVKLSETQRDQHVAFLYAYAWALDMGYIARAGEFLDKAQITCPVSSAQVPTLALETAYFEARHRANATSAREWLRRGSSKGSKYGAILQPRAQAAILLLEGKYREAEARASEALGAMREHLLADATLPDQWMQEEEEQLRQMLAEAQQAQEAL